jgi:hypothetical protein
MIGDGVSAFRSQNEFSNLDTKAPFQANDPYKPKEKKMINKPRTKL